MYSCVYTIGKPDCSTLKLSTTDPAVVDAPAVRDALTGTYQFIGEWKNVGTPIYRQVDGDPMSVWANKFYLYHSSKQWFVQRVRDLFCVFNSMKHNTLLKTCFRKKTNNIVQYRNQLAPRSIIIYIQSIAKLMIMKIALENGKSTERLNHIT